MDAERHMDQFTKMSTQGFNPEKFGIKPDTEKAFNTTRTGSRARVKDVLPENNGVASGLRGGDSGIDTTEDHEEK